MSKYKEAFLKSEAREKITAYVAKLVNEGIITNEKVRERDERERREKVC